MRARGLKPAIFKNELLGTADPILTILFEGLWCMADREGRLEDRPRRIKAEIFPYREGIDTDEMLAQLADMGFILRYETDQDHFIQICTFKKHQNPHKNEANSEIPPPPKAKKERVCDEKKLAPKTEVVQPLAEAVQPLEALRGLTPDSGLLTADSLLPDSREGVSSEEKPKTPEAPGQGDVLPFLPDRLIAEESAKRIMAAYQATVQPVHRNGGKECARTIERAIVDGLATEDTFHAAIKHYTAYCRTAAPNRRFRKAAHAFFVDGLWELYAQGVPDQDVAENYESAESIAKRKRENEEFNRRKYGGVGNV